MRVHPAGDAVVVVAEVRHGLLVALVLAEDAAEVGRLRLEGRRAEADAVDRVALLLEKDEGAS